MRIARLLAALAVGGSLLPASSRDARACGGCFAARPSQTGTVVTDHRMILAVSPAQTTLYDEIRYQGSPESFAWVLPVRGPVTVGLSSDVVFASLDEVTTTLIVAPPPPCPPPSRCSCEVPNVKTNFTSVVGEPAEPPVTVLGSAVVGPYETVQLASTDPTALESWLASHGYDVPAAVQPVVAAYVGEGFDFLAMRLVPGQGVRAMRPISVTSPGAGLTLPLRMVAAGTGPTVGITLWVVAEGRYEPQNFRSFTVSASELTWDWATRQSDYATVRARREASLGNGGWQIESALQISPEAVEQRVLRGAAGADYGPGQTLEGGADAAEDAATDGQTDGAPDAQVDDSAVVTGPDAVRARDLATLFPGGDAPVVVTRMRADLSQAALARDLVLQASGDQGTMSNFYRVTRDVNVPACPPSPVCTRPCSGVGGCEVTPLRTDRGGAWLALALMALLAAVRRTTHPG